MSRVMLAAFSLLVSLGCAVEPASVEYTPLDRSAATWNYCGAPEFHQVVRDSVVFWESWGLKLGREVACEEWAQLRIRDATGEDGGDLLGSQQGDDITLYRKFWESSEGRRHTTMRHELGHYFGFGHATSKGCLMYGQSHRWDNFLSLCEAERVTLGR